jgi:hypothetical protein
LHLGLCEIVGSLADAVAAKHGNRSGWQDLLLHILRSAPGYRDAGRLDAWDEAFRYARGDAESTSPIIELLDAIYDLGSYNMYGSFDVPGTQQEYDRLVRKFDAAGIPTPATPDLSDW